jgi:hypothetical protein
MCQEVFSKKTKKIFDALANGWGDMPLTTVSISTRLMEMHAPPARQIKGALISQSALFRLNGFAWSDPHLPAFFQKLRLLPVKHIVAR